MKESISTLVAISRKREKIISTKHQLRNKTNIKTYRDFIVSEFFLLQPACTVVLGWTKNRFVVVFHINFFVLNSSYHYARKINKTSASMYGCAW